MHKNAHRLKHGFSHKWGFFWRAGGGARTPAVCGCASRRFVLQPFFLGIPTWFSVLWFRSFVCFLFVLCTYFEYCVWRLCCVSHCSVPRSSLVALPSKPCRKKVLQSTISKSVWLFFFLTACPWQQHLGTWITSPTVSVAEAIRFPDVAWAKASFVCLLLFLSGARCLLWKLGVEEQLLFFLWFFKAQGYRDALVHLSHNPQESSTNPNQK